jgi:predicted kinase
VLAVGQDLGMALLILVNGAPGAGKSTLARRYVEHHPLALLLDIDELRTSLGGWRERTESRRLARELALAMVETHLRAGYDVVIPQYVGQPPLVEGLSALAAELGARFVFVVLELDPAVALERFRSRRRSLQERGVDHAEGDIEDADVERLIHDATGAIAEIASQRTDVIEVRAGGSPDVAYAALMAALGDDIGR